MSIDDRRGVRATKAATVGVLVAATLLLAACSDEEATVDKSSTSTTVASDPCDEVYQAGGGEPEGPDAIEQRGAPDLQPCDPGGSEMLVIDEIQGTGEEVTAGATVTVHYAGVDAPTGTEFDSSWSRGDTATFALDQVIPGWSDGMVGMKVGGRRTLVIPPDLAYGDSGPAPGQYLIFTVDLVGVEPPADSTPSTVPSGAEAPTTASTTIPG